MAMGRMMDAKFVSIIREDNRTTVTYRLYEGDMQDVRDSITGATVRQYVRDKVVRTATDVFEGVLSDDETRARLMRVLSGFRSKTIIPQQRIGHKDAESKADAPTPSASRQL